MTWDREDEITSQVSCVVFQGEGVAHAQHWFIVRMC